MVSGAQKEKVSWAQIVVMALRIRKEDNVVMDVEPCSQITDVGLGCRHCRCAKRRGCELAIQRA